MQVKASAAEAGEVQALAETNPPVFRPDVDIFESERGFTLQADLPGVRPEDLEVRYERGELTVKGRVSGRTPRENEQPLLSEFHPGSFERSFCLGDGIDGESITAQLEAGVLTLDLPRSAKAGPRRIEVKRA